MRLKQRYLVSCLLALGFCLVCSSPALAIKMLQPGRQSLDGFVVRASGELGLLIDAGSRSEQFVPLRGANEAVQAELEQRAVPRVPNQRVYDESAWVKANGDLTIRYIETYPPTIERLFIVDSIGDDSGGGAANPAKLSAALEAFRSAIMNSGDDSAALALNVLERRGALESAINAAINAADSVE